MQINQPFQQWQLKFEGDWPTSVTFLDDHRLAAGNRAGQICVWSLPEAGEPAPGAKSEPPNVSPIRLLDGHTNGITHLRATADGKTLISSSLDHSIRVWDVDAMPSGKRSIVLDGATREREARNKPAKEREAFLQAPGIELDVVEAAQVLDGHEGWVNGLDLSADGKRLISGDDRCLTIVRDLAAGAEVSRWRGYDRVWVRSAAISPDGKLAFTCEFAGRRSDFDVPAAQARLWNADDGSLKLDLLKVWTPEIKEEDRGDTYGYLQKWSKLIKRGLVCAAFSADGQLLAVGQGGETDTGQVHLVDVATGKIARTVSGHRYGVCDVKFSADGRFVLSAGRDTTVRICEVSSGKEVAQLGKERGGQFKDWLHALAISPDQSRVAAADIAGSVHVWRLAGD
ncbi:MAG: hypothetical protein KDB14_11125 [Planctomycetales bacterium]|nr:hypothetical protein [Planctomycetales bacterium]